MSATAYWSYPILPYWIVALTFFPTTFLEIAAYEEKLAQLGGWPNPQKRDPAEPTVYFYCKQSAKFCNGNVWLAQGTL